MPEEGKEDWKENRKREKSRVPDSFAVEPGLHFVVFPWK
ncbi:hypothetical protein SDC9_206414 [bioreactor metagenome]|uniref:Uncharacterized protein n=1 Tax=bioreactor metagenome TaxID=1076179 RepID=A0A645JGJ0_9ZZZZ